MTLTTIGPVCVEEMDLPAPLDVAFKKIKRLRTRQDSDKTTIAYSLHKAWKRDHVYVHSHDLLGIYIERDNPTSFKATVYNLKRKLNIKGEFLGDQDGILYFPWSDLHKLRQFHKQRKGRLEFSRKMKRKAD
jgi:hypothetical protein